MKIQLLADYRGHLTDECFYVAGEYEGGVTMPLPHAIGLVEAGRAVVVADKPAPKPKRARRSRKAKS